MVTENGSTPAGATGNVVLFPFLAKGHFNRFVALGEIICSRYPSVAVTLATTPRNMDFIRSSLPPDTPLRLHTLPFTPADHGLPAGLECVSGLPPPRQLIDMPRACRSLAAPFEDLVASLSPPLCIVADMFFVWAIDIARKHGAYYATKMAGAYGSAVFMTLYKYLPHVGNTDEEIPLPGHPEIVVRRSELPVKLLGAAQEGNPTVDFFREVMKHCGKADVVLCNTIEAIDTAGLKILQELFGVRVSAVGPLIREPASSSTSAEAAELMDWLDRQPPASVLYVSFGSQNSITLEEMAELAVGLERTKRPFIWVIRPPAEVVAAGAAGGGGGDEWLPGGFSKRMASTGQGFLVRGWAPQVRILEHASTAAFLTHCGWNSVLESLIRGLPMVGWPLGAEQAFNVKFLEEEAGVCVKVEGAPPKRAAAVERAVETVLGDSEKGKEVRRRAEGMKAVLPAAWEEGGSSSKVLEKLVMAARLVPNHC